MGMILSKIFDKECKECDGTGKVPKYRSCNIKKVKKMFSNKQNKDNIYK